MFERRILEVAIYWSVQTTILLFVTLTIGFFLNTSLKLENSYHELVRNDSTKAPTKGNNSCRYPLVLSANRSCEPPCDWSFISSSERIIYDSVLVNCLRIALVAMVITLVTWLACKSMRMFPHIVRFYILISSVSFTMAGIIPTQIATKDVNCIRGKYWNVEGIVSNQMILQGAVCHYCLLTLSFWLLCYVVNTYLLLVLDWRNTNPRKHHVTQLLFCLIMPLVFVGVCFIVKQPSYNMLFKDRLAILPSSPILVFGTITFPVQLSSGAALAMLVSIIRRIRKVSRNSRISANVIRSDEETSSLRHVEHHFLVLVFIYLLSTIFIFLTEAFLQDKEVVYLHEIHDYFSCLKTIDNCTRPKSPEFFLSNLKILTPGVFCVVSFFLLFINKETKAAWTRWLQTIKSTMSRLLKFFPFLRDLNVPFNRRECTTLDTERGTQASVVTLSIVQRQNPNVNIAQDMRICELKASSNVGEHNQGMEQET